MEELMMKKENEFHIALFPWLAYGHLLPYLEVSKLLAEKGYRVTFISTPKNIHRLPKLHQALSDSCLINFVELPLPEVDGLPNGVESTAEISIQKVPYLKKAYDMLQPPLIHFLQASDVNWIIHDFVCYWVPRVATQLGINSIFFHITNATSLAFVGPPSELTGGQRQKPEDFTVVPKWIDFPSNVAFKLHEMVSHWDCMDRDVADFERFAHAIQGCQFVTMRTCPKFEADSLSLLQKLYGKPAVPIGFLPPHHSNSVQGDDDEIKWKTLKEWLDNNKHRSVFYIAFGTEVSLSQDMMHELAYGIEKSRLPFIWVLNNRPLVEGVLGSDHIIPPEFEAQVSERGLIWRGWAPQLRILAHSSIGGFLTHCGWGSVIEVQ